MLFLLSLMNAFPFLGILAKSSDEALRYYYSVSSLTSLCFRVSCVLTKQLPGCSASFKWVEGLGLVQEQVNSGHLLLPQTVSWDGGGPENRNVSGGPELHHPLSCHPKSPTSEKNWRRLLSSHGVSAFS